MRKLERFGSSNEVGGCLRIMSGRGSIRLVFWKKVDWADTSPGAVHEKDLKGGFSLGFFGIQSLRFPFDLVISIFVWEHIISMVIRRISILSQDA